MKMQNLSWYWDVQVFRSAACVTVQSQLTGDPVDLLLTARDRPGHEWERVDNAAIRMGAVYVQSPDHEPATLGALAMDILSKLAPQGAVEWCVVGTRKARYVRPVGLSWEQVRRFSKAVQALRVLGVKVSKKHAAQVLQGVLAQG